MATQVTIEELVSITRNGDEEQKEDVVFSFGIFPNAIAQAISGDTQINIIGATRLVNAYGIAHTIKFHGNVKEFERNQVPVHDADFDLIQTIVNDFDTYQRASNDKRGNPGIYFQKVIKNVNYTVCMTYTEKRDRYASETIKKLTLSTMYKKPI